MNKLLLIVIASLAAACSSRAEVNQLNWELLATEAQEPLSFTQGLQLEQGQWFISSGGYGRSFVAKVDNANQRVLAKRKLPPNWFAEGLTLFEDKLYLLSWKRQRGLVLSPDTLKPIKTFTYKGEGWGLSHNGQQLIMSNGSNQLNFYQAEPFKLLHSIDVHSTELSSAANQEKWKNLNELEYFKGLIWANIWQQNIVIAIDPESGEVRHQLDFSALVPAQFKDHPNNVLNGLAWDKSRQALWLSGKNWPQRFLVTLPSLE